ncbi:hypothetical protein [Haloferula sp. BvORR071]|uniref:hypothetical protein n=1 Tax=Haloferula sp. BvORR071 TaxID=1396141 RepID=UPI00054D1AA5|nr:hypothetical protein [Haloferula sp. BvORR071]
MKTPLALIFVALIGVAAFLMGRGKPVESAGHATSGASSQSSPAGREAKAPTRATTDPRVAVKPRVGTDVLTTEKAAQLSSEERIALLKKAALLADPEKQADILCGLISAMNENELLESTKTLLDAQRRGNNWSQEVWNTLWTQWGRVNAEACLSLSKKGTPYPGWNGLDGLNTPNDYRCWMAGWLEAHPEAAMAWAGQAKDNLREATGAAFAITSSANGDLKQMESSMLAIKGDKLTLQACFGDYLDLAISTGDKPQVSAVYEQLDPALRAAAWPAVLERLAYSDPSAAGAWLKEHGKDPGYDARATLRVVMESAGNDPAGTAKWAIELAAPRSDEVGTLPHPGVMAVQRWLGTDPEAAEAWLRTQPADAPWVTAFKGRQ